MRRCWCYEGQSGETWGSPDPSHTGWSIIYIGFTIFFWKLVLEGIGSHGGTVRHSLVVVLEKKGIHQETDILENYGIDSETDVSSVLDQDDFSKLVSQVLPYKETRSMVWSCVCTCREHAAFSPSSLDERPSLGGQIYWETTRSKIVYFRRTFRVFTNSYTRMMYSRDVPSVSGKMKAQVQLHGHLLHTFQVKE